MRLEQAQNIFTLEELQSALYGPGVVMFDASLQSSLHIYMHILKNK